MAKISLKNIKKIYDNDFLAIPDLSLDINDNEFLILIGPSGSGKSTLLRMIAGLEDISGGELYIEDELMNEVEPKNRNIAMVFQNYALYPHLTVYENIAFGLKMRKIDKEEIKKRVAETAEILDLTEYLERKPNELSGGQRQRVAMGRAIVRKPKVFLMDEPLSNLDAKLRVQMRAEISKLYNREKKTFIYVTHDQTEAMTLGTRIVILKDGEIQQVDTPQNLYEKPKNRFVGGFIGSPKMNFFRADVIENDSKIKLDVKGVMLEIPAYAQEKLKTQNYINKEILVGIRAEDIIISETKKEHFQEFKVKISEMLGAEELIHFDYKGRNIIAMLKQVKKHPIGEKLYFALNNEKLHLFDGQTEVGIVHHS